MNRGRTSFAVALTVAGIVYAKAASAERANQCSPPITRATVVACALASSLPSRAARYGAAAVEGRWVAASPILPSNPVVSLTGSKRFATPSTDLIAYSWSAQLSQEIEIAGQRGARRRLAGAERDAQAQVVVASDREAAVNAWTLYFEAIAAQEDLELMRRVEGFSRRAMEVTAAAADKGLTAGVDADVADATFLRIAQARIGAEQHGRRTNAALASLLGFDPAVALTVEGDLEPLPQATSITAAGIEAIIERRPEVQALEAEKRALQAKADYYRRARFPNPALSIFVQNDEVNNAVFGVGLSFPLVLPQPVGRTYAGEIRESDALAEKLRTQADQFRRTARQEIVVALQAYEASRQVRALFTGQRLARAIKGLQTIATEIEGGRLAVKDAIVAQQSFLDLLRGAIAARKDLGLASVALARAAGAPLERGGGA